MLRFAGKSLARPLGSRGWWWNTVQDLILEGTSIDAAPGSVQPVLRLHDVDGVLVRQSRVSSVDVSGVKSRAVRLLNTESKITSGPGVEPVTLK